MNVLVLSSLLVSLGLLGVLTRRDLVAVLASVEVMLGGANVLLVAVATSAGAAGGAATGVGAGLIVLVLAAAEAGVGLALLSELIRRRRGRVDDLGELSG